MKKLTIIFTLLIFCTSCGLFSTKKVKKPAYKTLSARKLDCITSLILMDIKALDAGTTCEKVYERR